MLIIHNLVTWIHLYLYINMKNIAATRYTHLSKKYEEQIFLTVREKNSRQYLYSTKTSPPRRLQYLTFAATFTVWMLYEICSFCSALAPIAISAAIARSGHCLHISLFIWFTELQMERMFTMTCIQIQGEGMWILDQNSHIVLHGLTLCAPFQNRRSMTLVWRHFRSTHQDLSKSL